MFPSNRYLALLLLLLLLLLLVAPGCERPAREAEPPPPIHVRAVRPARHRARAAAITIRFAHGAVEPGKVSSGYDHLQAGAVFADAGRRDTHLVRDLTGQAAPGPALPTTDSCIRLVGALSPAARAAAKPTDHMQLLDVGNLVLRSGDRQVPMRISMVPSLFSAIRGVRYDVELDNARGWLAASSLSITATGGDGVAPFVARIVVLRPVRFTHVGGRPVRGGHVVADPDATALELRWGSVDGTASLHIVVGAESGKGLLWVRCRLHDDGAFTVPSEVLSDLPARSARRPWLISLIRARTAKIPGFSGDSLRLELVDRVRVR